MITRSEKWGAYATRDLCYWWHSGDEGQDEQNYAGRFNEWCARYPAMGKRFRDLVTQHGPPFTFRAFFDFFVEMMSIGARPIFSELVEVGRANEVDGIAWAKVQAGLLIQRYRYLVTEWVRMACDRKIEESWIAPRFLPMKPAGHERFDSDRVWERMDAASTSKLLDSFADEFVVRLENQNEDDAGAAYLNAAKRWMIPESGNIIEGITVQESSLEAKVENAKTERINAILKRIRNDKDRSTATNEEAALIFDVNEHTIRNWRDEGKLVGGAKRGTIKGKSILRNLDS